MVPPVGDPWLVASYQHQLASAQYVVMPDSDNDFMMLGRIGESHYLRAGG